MPILEILVIALGAVTLLSLVASASWPTELISHFRPHLIAAGILLAILSLPFGRYEWPAISTGLAMINYAALPAPPWVEPDVRLAGKPGLTVVWANVWTKQRPLERTLEWAKAQGADLILIGEFPASSPAGVLAGDYSHRLDAGPIPEGKIMATRLVALSRLPLSDTQIHSSVGSHHRTVLTFAVATPAGPLNIVAIHPAPPMTSKLLKERDDQIRRLATLVRAPFLIAGDFNATPWCAIFKAIPGKRVGAFLRSPTWLTSLPLLGLPIDHLMVSPDIRASAFRVAPLLGSDHRALLARIHLPETRSGP